MWILPTRGRPEKAQRLMNACGDTSMTHRGVMFVDGTAGDYEGIELPENWIKTSSEDNKGVGWIHNWFFKEYPNEPFYGFLADDFIPKTQEWDKRLAHAAGSSCIAYCFDECRSIDEDPSWITSACAMGGDLVRAVGWYAPPPFWQAGIDYAWGKIGREFKLMRYLSDVTVIHEHWQWGGKKYRRARDWVDNDGSSEMEAVEKWFTGKEFEQARADVSSFLVRESA